MGLVAPTLWIAREWRRDPIAWLLASGAVLLGPVCMLALPWAIVSVEEVFYLYIDPIWYLSSYLGATVGLLLLSRGGAIWGELGPLRQSLLAAAVVGVCSLIHGFAAVCALGILGSVHGLRWLPALLCAGHWCALGTFVQRTTMRLGAKWLVMSCVGWWIPAFLAGVPAWDRLHWFLGPDRHLAAGFSPAETSLGVLVDTIPIVAWWVAAALLPTRSAFS